MWRVKTDSNRHQSGGPVVGVTTPDMDYDIWYWCNIRKRQSPGLRTESCEDAMTWNAYGSARTHEEVLRMIEDTPDKIARRLASTMKTTVRLPTAGWGIRAGYYAITPADKKCDDRPNQPNR